MSKIAFLNSNMLKIIACITMVVDHVGFLIFPNLQILRIIGRISFPLFAFMIAIGTYYTKNRLKHILLISTLGILMQIVLYLFVGMTDFSIFITFSISIILIYLIDYIHKNINEKNILKTIISSLCLIGLIIYLFWFTTRFDYFFMNYGIYGILSPVVIYIIRKYISKIYIYISIIAFAVMIIIYTNYLNNPLGYYAFLSLPFILFYNGKRGKLNLKYFFYLFYPLHFVIIYGIGMLLGVI